jgi:hypothetical protein
VAKPGKPALERIIGAHDPLSGLVGLAAHHVRHQGLTMGPAVHDFPHGEKVALWCDCPTGDGECQDADPQGSFEFLRFEWTVGGLSQIGADGVPGDLLPAVDVRVTILRNRFIMSRFG